MYFYKKIVEGKKIKEIMSKEVVQKVWYNSQDLPPRDQYNKDISIG